MCSSLGRHYRAGQSSHQFLNRGNRKMQKRGKALKTKPGQPAESFRTCKLESTKEFARSWFRIRLRHIQWIKSLGCGPGRKGFRPPLRMTARPHPRREATLTRVDFQEVKRLLKDSHGDPIPKAVSATRNRGSKESLFRAATEERRCSRSRAWAFRIREEAWRPRGLPEGGA